MKIETNYNIGDMVYLITDIDQYPRMVSRIEIRPGSTIYCLVFGSTESWHFEIEMQIEKDVMKAITD